MTAGTGGTSPRPPESSPDVDLFGSTTTGRRRRPRYRVVLQGIGPAGQTSTSVRVALVDGETGQRIGARTVPFEWVRDVGTSGGEVMAVIEDGVSQ